MLSLLCARTRSALLPLALASTFSLHAQSGYAPQAGEYAIAGNIAGDQVHPQTSLRPDGGIVVWQDNVTDGDGWGISAQWLNNNFSGSLSTFRVNANGVGDQENPHVALLNDGGAVFVWQGGPKGRQHIFARFMAANGTFTTGDVMVNSYVADQQITPAVAKLANGNLVVVWAGFQQDGDKQGVFARIMSPVGGMVSGEFQVNETTLLNQRTPAVTALGGGGFAVAWISESSKGADPVASGGELFSVDAMVRLYAASAVPTGHEFKGNTAGKFCANPALAGLADGGFTLAWSEHSAEVRATNVVVSANGWDVCARKFGNDGTAANSVKRVNTFVYGDQYGPSISVVGNDQLVVWTSIGQDGSAEGVFGQLLQGSGELSGGEFRVNTTTIAAQKYPMVASDGASRFLVSWGSYNIGSRFDTYAQRYSSTQPLPVLPAPYLTALSGSKLVVSWASLSGYNVTSYGLYLDGNSTPVSATGNSYTMTGLAQGSSHTVRLDYLLADGRRGNPSAVATGSTWGEDGNFDGLPDDWQAKYWGANSASWGKPWEDSDGDGVSNLDEFLAGTNPLDASSALRINLTVTNEGWLLNWNTEPGLFYQVVVSSDWKTWSNVGSMRYAAGRTDSMLVNPGTSSAYYKVLRVR